MSVNRENVVWQSKDGSWNRGFFAFENINSDSEDFDYEWDVEYDYGHFYWVSTGHRTKAQAVSSWRGANPGSWGVSPYIDGDKEENDHYDLMAEWVNNPAAEEKFIKKENARKNKQHFQKLVELMDEKRNFVGLDVHVSIAQNEDTAYSQLGAFYEYSGRIREDDGMIGIVERGVFHELYNKNTKTFVASVNKISEQKRYGYGYGGYGW